jgi:hypothetical protein
VIDSTFSIKDDCACIAAVFILYRTLLSQSYSVSFQTWTRAEGVGVGGGTEENRRRRRERIATGVRQESLESNRGGEEERTRSRRSRTVQAIGSLDPKVLTIQDKILGPHCACCRTPEGDRVNFGVPWVVAASGGRQQAADSQTAQLLLRLERNVTTAQKPPAAVSQILSVSMAAAFADPSE